MYIVKWTNLEDVPELYAVIDRISADYIAKGFARISQQWTFVFVTNPNGVGAMERLVAYGPNGEVH
jgi:hypothetical protein